MTDQTEQLKPLLHYLDTKKISTQGQFQKWEYERIFGGYNNILYRVNFGKKFFAIKFTIKDERNRAWREYHSLLVLQNAGLHIAPKPVFLDLNSYSQPVVVMTWLRGLVSRELPQNESEWKTLLSHYATIHSITQKNCPIDLPMAALAIDDPANNKQFVLDEVAKAPPGMMPAELSDLLEKFMQLELPILPKAPMVLCRSDPNTLNFVRQENCWLSVDWESSGWGDPAFDIADIIIHPKYFLQKDLDQQMIIDMYSALANSDAIGERIKVYSLSLLIYWCFRWHRYLYEVPRQMDVRLVNHEPLQGFEQKIMRRYQYYLEKAFALTKN